MNDKICQKCNRSNPSDMKFCMNCGVEISQADELPATVFGGFPTNPNTGQTSPDYGQQNFQQPQPQNFQQQANYQTPNYGQPNFQQSNFQQPNFQPQYQNTSASSGNTKKVLLGIGGILLGFIMLASGGVKLYRAFSKPSYTPTPYYSPAPQNLYSNTSRNSGSSNLNTYSNRREDSSSSVLATGTYKGSGKNTTYNQTGDFLLRIDSVDPSGKVRAYFSASNGLYGSSVMTGTIDSSKKLLLEGKLEDGKFIAINATVTGDTISAGYGIADSKSSQSGNFTVTRR